MAKAFKMNLKTGDLAELGGTDLLPHPGNFPLGSVESRAAARAMIRPDRLRAGDSGTEKGGSWWFIVNDPQSGGIVRIVFPKDFSAASQHKSPST